MPHLGHLSVAILFAEICLESEFSCGDGSCIPLTQTCSGVAECLHGQDEIGCGKNTSHNRSCFDMSDPFSNNTVYVTLFTVAILF